jgi:hypothetical protein
MQPGVFLYAIHLD